MTIFLDALLHYDMHELEEKKNVFFSTKIAAVSAGQISTATEHQRLYENIEEEACKQRDAERRS
jgi:hypothetical protein